MLEHINKDSLKFDSIFFAYYRANELDKKTDFIQKLGLTKQDVQILEREALLGEVFGDYDEALEKDEDFDVSQFDLTTGEVEEIESDYAFTNSLFANTPKEKVDELLDLLAQKHPNLDETIEQRIISNFSKEEIVEFFG